MLSAGGLKLLTATDWLSCCCHILSFVHRTNQRRHRKQTDRGQTSKRWFHSLSDNHDISGKGVADIFKFVSLRVSVSWSTCGKSLVGALSPCLHSERWDKKEPEWKTHIQIHFLCRQQSLLGQKTTASCYHPISRLIQCWHIYVTNPESDGARLFLFLFCFFSLGIGLLVLHSLMNFKSLVNMNCCGDSKEGHRLVKFELKLSW